MDPEFYRMAVAAIPGLARLSVNGGDWRVSAAGGQSALSLWR